MKKKILVFGASGNLGMYFVDYLMSNLNKKEYEIIALGTKEKYPFSFYRGKYVQIDITKKEDFVKLPKKNVYAVVDFAGILPAYFSENDPYKYIEVNTVGTLNILEYMKECNADRIIYTQTWADLNGYLSDNSTLNLRNYI